MAEWLKRGATIGAYLTLNFIEANGPIGPKAKFADHSRFRTKQN